MNKQPDHRKRRTPKDLTAWLSLVHLCFSAVWTPLCALLVLLHVWPVPAALALSAMELPHFLGWAYLAHRKVPPPNLGT